jgi:hypothetical protein
VFELAPYAKERNEEENNTNLPLQRTGLHITPGPTPEQENTDKNCQQMERCSKQFVINNKNHAPVSLDINE